MRFRRDGSAAALARVFEATAPELLLIATQVAPAGVDAEDLVQATFLAAIESAQQWDASRPLQPWLVGILVNCARAERRRAARRNRDLAAHADNPRRTVSDPVSEAEAAETARVLQLAIERLPEHYRSALMLRLAYGLEPRQIARALDCPVETVKTRLQRGRELLKRALPAGLATSVLAGLARGRGLSAVRAAVLAAVPPTGVLVMKKLVPIGVAVLLLAASFWTSGLSADLDAPQLLAPRTLTEAKPSVAPESEPSATVRSEQREQVPAATQGIHGTVRDPAGKPIAGAEVRLLPCESWRSEPALLETTTDREGRFCFDASQEWRSPLSIRAVAGGHGGTSRDLEFPAECIDLRLAWLVEIHGVVRDARTGTAIAGARIARSRKACVTSDRAGRYSIPDVPAYPKANYRLDVYAEGHALTRVQVRARGPNDVRADIALGRGRLVRLAVVDAESHQPIRAGRVFFRGVPIGKTDSGGGFALRTTADTALSLRIEADGYLAVTWTLRAWTSEHTEFTLPMRRPARIDGTIVDGHGDPVQGAYLSFASLTWDVPKAEAAALGLPGRAYDERIRVKPSPTMADGRFTIVVPRRPEPFVVLVHREGYAPERMRVTARRTLRIVLHRGATIHGQVRYNGEPWQGTLRWEHTDSKRKGFTETREGRFAMTDVPPGRIVVTPVGGQRTVPADQTASLVVEEGKVYERDFAWTEKLVTVRGKVTSHDGRCINASVRAWLRGSHRFSDWVVPDRNGRYALRLVPPGPYDIQVLTDSIPLERQRVPAGAIGVDFVLPELGKVRLRVVDAKTKAPLQWYSHERVLGWRPSGERGFRRLRVGVKDGRAEFELPAGLVDLSLRLRTHRPRVVRGVLVRAVAKPMPVLVELEKGIEVRVRCRTGDGVLRDHALFLLSDDERQMVRGPFPPQGAPAFGDDMSWSGALANTRVHGIHLWLQDPALTQRLVRTRVFEGLAPGRYHLVVFPNDLVVEPETIEVRQGTETVDITWRR